MKHISFLSCIIACSVFGLINVQADNPKEKTSAVPSDYFSKPLYFYANAKVVKINVANNKPYVDLEIEGDIASFEDRPFRQHENVTVSQMIKYAKKHKQINYLMTSFDASKEVFFEGTPIEQKSPTIIRLNLKYILKAKEIQNIAKFNRSVTLTLLNY